MVSFLLRGMSAPECLSRQEFHGSGSVLRSRGRRDRFGLRMAVIVIFEIFENVADVQEGIAIQADIHEGGLHAGEDAGNSAFIDAADERELFFAFDVNFD